jgi:mannose-6-phosphate isomerase-like protein (cupin superfamily)
VPAENRPAAVDLDAEYAKLTFLADRTPDMAHEDTGAAFARLGGYRDGGIFIGHYRGNSEWERHPVGDEIVMAVDGATTIFLLLDGQEQAHALAAGELIVVPQGVWHRFETPEGVKVMSVTPQPTEHRTEHPSGA